MQEVTMPFPALAVGLHALLALAIFATAGGSSALAQCTDADTDGFYFEAGCTTPRDLMKFKIKGLI